MFPIVAPPAVPPTTNMAAAALNARAETNGQQIDASDNPSWDKWEEDYDARELERWRARMAKRDGSVKPDATT